MIRSFKKGGGSFNILFPVDIIDQAFRIWSETFSDRVFLPYQEPIKHQVLQLKKKNGELYNFDSDESFFSKYRDWFFEDSIEGGRILFEKKLSSLGNLLFEINIKSSPKNYQRTEYNYNTIVDFSIQDINNKSAILISEIKNPFEKFYEKKFSEGRQLASYGIKGKIFKYLENKGNYSSAKQISLALNINLHEAEKYLNYFSKLGEIKRVVHSGQEPTYTLEGKGLLYIDKVDSESHSDIKNTFKNENVDKNINKTSRKEIRNLSQKARNEIHKEEKKIESKKIWQIIVGIGVIVGIVAGLFQIRDSLKGEGDETTAKSLTVRVRDKRGFDELVLPSRGEVTLIYGDDSRTEQINNEGEASFRQMKDVFFGPENCINIIFSDPENEPYKALYPDSCYKIVSGRYVDLIVELKGIDALQGNVRDSKTGKSIEGAKVIIMGESTFSDKNGYFKLHISEENQRKYHTIRIEKEGYVTWDESDKLIDATIEVPFLLKPL